MDGSILLYNMTEMVARQAIKLLEAGGFTQLQFSVNDVNMLLAASTEGWLFVIDGRSGEIIPLRV